MLARTRSILLTVLGAEIALLVVSGIALFFLYRPSARQTWGLSGDEYLWTLAGGLRLIHRLASWLAVLTAVAAGVLVALRNGPSIRRWPGVTLGAGSAISTLLATFTGYLLPWDQLALREVAVDTNIRGYTKLFDSSVRFVLVGSTEVGPSTILWWFAVHALVLGPALIGLVVLAGGTTPSPGALTISTACAPRS